MPISIPTPPNPERGGCQPRIIEQPIEMPDESPIQVPVEDPIPVEMPERVEAV